MAYMKNRMVLLNGPSSAGKSTIANALAVLLNERTNGDYRVVSIDDFLVKKPGEMIYEDDVFEISAALNAKARRLWDAGHGVIIDHVITSSRIFEALRDAFSDTHICLVLVTCPLDILRRREAARGDRTEGTAESSLTYLYPRVGYELTVDSAESTPVECAEIIAEHMNM